MTPFVPGIDSEMHRHIATAFGKAFRHTERICKRKHIMADRVERVNQLITSLRRELHVIKPEAAYTTVYTDVCRKEIWYDIGILNQKFPTYGLTVSHYTVQQWIDESKKMSIGMDASRYEIESDLEELARGLTGCFSAVEDVKRINQESEHIASDICKLFE